MSDANPPTAAAFRRPHHHRIAQVLQALDGAALAGWHCLFGGGTAMVLRDGPHREYRESVDMDFLVSDRASWRGLRERLTGPEGLQAITRAGHRLNPLREIRADQYGIRTLLAAGADGEAGQPIKFEIVLEARIELDVPGRADCIEGVATLTALDMACSKLLANSDRWADDGVFSRDLIDLAMLEAPRTLLRQALVKAQSAYGEAVTRDLARAIEQLLGRDGRLERCMAALQIELPRALLWQRIGALRSLVRRRSDRGDPSPASPASPRRGRRAP